MLDLLTMNLISKKQFETTTGKLQHVPKPESWNFSKQILFALRNM